MAPTAIIPYSSRQLSRATGQDAALRSALAFVVLRRRLAAKAAAAAAAASSAPSRHNGVVDLTGGRKRSRGDDQNNTSSKSSASASLATPQVAMFADKSHVSHLVRLAITTALPLGDDVLGIGAGAGAGADAVTNTAKGRRRGPIVYNHRLASSRGIGCASTTATARQMAVLDGLLTNLSAQLSIVARSSPRDARSIVRREFLDILLAKADAFEYRSSRSSAATATSTRGGGDHRLIFSGEEEGYYDDYDDDDDSPAAVAAASTRLLLDRTRLVLAVCTVLHRLVACGADSEAIPAAIVGAASSYLRHVYDGTYPDGFDVVGADDSVARSSMNSGGGGRSGDDGSRKKKVSFQEDYDDDEDEEDDDDDDEEEDHFTTVTAQVISLPRIGDTVAVNLLILLEEVGLPTHYRSYHGRPLSSSGNVILGALRGGFGQDLTLSPPLMVTSDAAMFVREEELRIIAEIRRRKRRMKRKKSGAAGAGAGAMGGGTVNYIPLLDPGAKLMLRLALWDLVEKLSV